MVYHPKYTRDHHHHHHYYCLALVPGLSLRFQSCWVNITSRRGIKQLGISSGSIFILFSSEISRAPHSQQPGEIPSPGLLMTTLSTVQVYSQICFGEETSRNHPRLITEATSNINIFIVKEVLCLCFLKKIAGPHALWLSNFLHILYPCNFAI